ncbi:MAG: CPBP family intramembrane metalloprotease [Polyangiaceae bacterium]|nr:CPBP family intramembrane metalloprotease [Polyangiaceae bacterium]
MLLLSRPPPNLVQAKEVGGLAGFIETAKPILPALALLVILPVLWWMFRSTWRALDQDAHKQRAELVAQGKVDNRPMVALVMCALILTMQEYYGGRAYFDRTVMPMLTRLDATHAWLHVARYDELWGYAWWASTRISGYVAPFFVWKIAFRNDSVKDFGLRIRGFLDHAWIYGLFLAVVLPAMLVVAQSPDFSAYYPFYKTSHRSWFDFLAWESMYFAQFFALEMFFRGFWLGVLRKSFGSGAIFSMVVPYCMIHYGKPYLEASGAIVAGIALGSLSMKTRSIYQGFLVHITVAGLMDWLALRRRHCTPLVFWPPETPAGCTEQAALRDTLAQRIEIVSGSLAAIALAIVIVLAVRARRRHLQA